MGVVSAAKVSDPRLQPSVEISLSCRTGGKLRSDAHHPIQYDTLKTAASSGRLFRRVIEPRRLDVRVAEHLLHLGNVGAVIECVGCRGGAHGMGTEPLDAVEVPVRVKIVVASFMQQQPVYLLCSG